MIMMKMDAFCILCDYVILIDLWEANQRITSRWMASFPIIDWTFMLHIIGEHFQRSRFRFINVKTHSVATSIAQE